MVLRIVLTLFAVALLALPWLKLVGGLLLFWIGVKLLVPEDGGDDVSASDNLLAAIKTILIADLVMSLDNVIAVAAAAGGSLMLLILGLAISIPLVVFGATLLMKLMERYPVIITVGAALLGLVAGEMLVTDPAGAGLGAGASRRLRIRRTANRRCAAVEPGTGSRRDRRGDRRRLGDVARQAPRGRREGGGIGPQGAAGEFLTAIKVDQA